MSWLVPAFLLGLFGSAHCVLMCGGIASALSSDLVQIGRGGFGPPRAEARGRRKPDGGTHSKSAFGGLPRAVAYNVGRIGAYAALGALVGALGRAVDFVPVLGVGRIVLRLATGLLLASAGLWLAGAFGKFAMVERVGAPIWRRVAPVATRLARSRSTLAAVGVGALWGLMPCGLVYAAFGLALASGAVAKGALVMAAFGVGTAPAMLATGLASARIAPAIRTRAWIRRTAGALVFVFGAIDVASAGASLAHPERPTCACHHAR